MLRFQRKADGGLTIAAPDTWTRIRSALRDPTRLETTLARRSPRRSSRRKLRWTQTEPRDHRNNAPAWAEGDRGERYVISGSGDTWEASVTLPDGTTTILASGVSGKQAYWVCVRHYHGPLDSLD